MGGVFRVLKFASENAGGGPEGLCTRRLDLIQFQTFLEQVGQKNGKKWTPSTISSWRPPAPPHPWRDPRPPFGREPPWERMVMTSSEMLKFLTLEIRKF